jgi:5-methyltetrahydropteroyltriglutamate--homocysteine methyltransferase
MTTPPFRADHVGSLLRPEELIRARDRYLGPQTPDSSLGPHDNPALRGIEDRCIGGVVALQERVGLRAVTDGEFRRRSWLLEMIMGWDGFRADRAGNSEVRWRSAQGVETQGSTAFFVDRPIRWKPGAVVRAFEFLRSRTTQTPKVTMPAPSIIDFFTLWDDAAKRIYPEIEAFWDDLIAAYRQEIAALVAAGATYIQLDDTAFAMLCDERFREFARSVHHRDPDQLVATYAEKINAAIAGVPDHVTLAMHQCRGNREGQWMAEGAYDRVADALLGTINVNVYLLEYDTARAGGFAPLRYLPKGKRVMLGLVSTKTAELESVDALLKRVDEAAKFAPLDQLGICPQCGFASSIKGNPMSEAEEEAKLRRVVEVAARVWG